MTKFAIAGLALSAALTMGAAQAQVGHDLKNAGRDTGHAARTATHKTVHGTKHVYHKTTRGTRNLGRRAEDKPTLPNNPR